MPELPDPFWFVWRVAEGEPSGLDNLLYPLPGDPDDLGAMLDWLLLACQQAVYQNARFRALIKLEPRDFLWPRQLQHGSNLLKTLHQHYWTVTEALRLAQGGGLVTRHLVHLLQVVANVPEWRRRKDDF